MTSVIKISSTFILDFVIAINLQAQFNSDEQFYYAKKLHDEEKYFDAVTELKRLLFFDNTNKYSYEANKLIGLSYKQGAKFSDAIYHFAEAESNSLTVEIFTLL